MLAYAILSETGVWDLGAFARVMRNDIKPVSCCMSSTILSIVN